MKASRLDRVMKGMQKMGLDQALVTATESVYYLTGQWIAPGERLLALLIDPKGVKLFVNHMFQVPKVEGLELVEFDDADDSVASLASRVSSGRLGVDKAWPSRFLLSLMEKRPDVHPVNGSAPVDEARMLKDAEEIAALRISSHMNDRVTGALRTKLVEGETEMDAAQRYGELGRRGRRVRTGLRAADLLRRGLCRAPPRDGINAAQKGRRGDSGRGRKRGTTRSPT